MRAAVERMVPTSGTGWAGVPLHGGVVSVLVVSESIAWQSEMAQLLGEGGYSVHLDDRGDAAVTMARAIDIAVVDLSIATRSMAAVFTAVRARHQIPILAVSPEGCRERTVLEAYAAGADQLVARRVRPHELTARIRAMLRRCPPRPADPAAGGGDHVAISLDTGTGFALVAGRQVLLTAREAEVLDVLLQRPGRVVTRGRLIGEASDRGADRALDALMRSVRSKLEAAEGQRRILAVRGVGFRLLSDRELHGSG